MERQLVQIILSLTKTPLFCLLCVTPAHPGKAAGTTESSLEAGRALTDLIGNARMALTLLPACISPALICFNAVWKALLTLNLLNLHLAPPPNCIRRQQCPHVCRIGSRPRFMWSLQPTSNQQRSPSWRGAYPFSRCKLNRRASLL